MLVQEMNSAHLERIRADITESFGSSLRLGGSLLDL